MFSTIVVFTKPTLLQQCLYVESSNMFPIISYSIWGGGKMEPNCSQCILEEYFTFRFFSFVVTIALIFLGNNGKYGHI
jgi:hypothetical protein